MKEDPQFQGCDFTLRDFGDDDCVLKSKGIYRDLKYEAVTVCELDDLSNAAAIGAQDYSVEYARKRSRRDTSPKAKKVPKLLGRMRALTSPECIWGRRSDEKAYEVRAIKYVLSRNFSGWLVTREPLDTPSNRKSGIFREQGLQEETVCLVDAKWIDETFNSYVVKWAKSRKNRWCDLDKAVHPDDIQYELIGYYPANPKYKQWRVQTLTGEGMCVRKFHRRSVL